MTKLFLNTIAFLAFSGMLFLNFITITPVVFAQETNCTLNGQPFADYQSCIGAGNAGYECSAAGCKSSGSTSDATGNSSGSAGCPQGWEPLAGGTCAPPAPVKGGLFETKTVGQLITNVLKILLGLAGMIAVALIVWGGFQYMTSGGNAEAAEKGRTTLINAIIGLVIVMVAWLIIQLITNLLYKGTAF